LMGIISTWTWKCDNEMYLWKTHYMDYKDFAELLREKRRRKPEYGLAYGRLRCHTSTFWRRPRFIPIEKNTHGCPFGSAEAAALRVA